MSDTNELHVSAIRSTDPYAAAASTLLTPTRQQADLVWESLVALATTRLIDERSETNLHAVVHIGMNLIPVRDFVMASIALMEAEDAAPYLLALGACVGSAPAEYRGHVAAATAMLSAAFDVDRSAVERLARMGEGTSLAQLVLKGLAMRAPASLYLQSMRHCMPQVKEQLQAL